MKILLAALLALVPASGFAAESYGFTVALSFSPQAAQKLASLHESVSGTAYYYGWPAPAAKKKADSMGQIGFDNEAVTVDATAGTISFTGKTVKRNEIAWLAKHQVLVTVNVYSARQSDPDNFLDCDAYDGPVADAAAKSPAIACKLIGEK